MVEPGLILPVNPWGEWSPLAENAADGCQRLGPDAEVGPVAALLAFDEAGLEEDLEVMANGRLGEPKWSGEVADARFAVRLRLDEAEQAKASWLGEDLEQGCEALRIRLSDLVLEERRAAGGDRGERFHVAKDIDSGRCDWQNCCIDRHQSPRQEQGERAKEQPEVLFVCVHNAGRSQMAAGLVKLRSGGRIHVRSAGSDPAQQINPAVVEAMREVGVDMTQEFPKPLTDEVVRPAVITMGCGDACPVYPGKKYEDWELDDPADQDLESVRKIRDEIDERVRHLICELLPSG
jgi:arsenate reductase (thioredoxin)